MNSFKKTNNILGWVVGGLASLVYLLTKEATVSLWDCGEFISCAYKLEVSHSPGAPFFSILARIWILLFGDNPETVATAVNSLSAVASGLTVMFLFWTITHFGRKLSRDEKGSVDDKRLLIFGAGLVGAFAFCFSDTFWFSAVEGEVYALSSFIMALVFWAMLKWEEVADQPHADRWLLLIALIMGMSIGVHLLNLLTIPSLVLVYYFRKTKKVSVRGGLTALAIGAAILGIVQYGIILYIPQLAFKFDVIFVNDLGLPFNTGIITFYILLVAALVGALRFARQRGMYYLQLGILATVFIFLGYSTYVSMVFRSAADPAIDMGSPDTAPRLNSFLSREQFGNVPLLSGPYYTSFNPQSIVGTKDLGPNYYEGKNSYEYLDYKREYEFSAEANKFFPRIWDGNNDAHVQFYNQFLQKAPGEEATVGDNFKFFFQHQFWHMYMRYFMWNFAGRANDYQGRYYGEPRKSPWVSGIKFLDQIRVGDLDLLPDSYSKSKARNNLYMLPLILGILGMIFLYRKKPHDFWTVLTLFFFTGIAIMIFVNNTPDQPRERDYSYVGSFYAFAIWIGLGVWMVADFIQKSVIKNNLKTSSVLATVICFLAVPVIMGFSEWDDHDRSKKTIGTAVGKNYLESCAPNAILFTEGDNDTYPLWFCQEVLGIRRDVRIINLSLLSIDWYIDQLHRKINDAPAVKMLWQPEDYLSSRRDIVTVLPNAPQEHMDIRKAVLAAIDPNNVAPTQGGGQAYMFPTTKLKMPVDRAVVAKNKIVPPSLQDRIVDEIVWDIGKDRLYKNDQTVLNIIAANMWDRPIYFSTTIRPSNFQGLEQYLLLEGSCLRVSPVYTENKNPNDPGTVNIEKSWDLMMNKYEYGGGDDSTVYFDEPNRRSLTNFRAGYGKLAKALLQKGDTTRAMQALDRATNKISTVCLPNDISTLFLTEVFMAAGAKDKALKLTQSQLDDTRKLMAYAKTIMKKDGLVIGDLQFGVQVASQLAAWAQQYQMPEIIEECSKLIQQVGMAFPYAVPEQMRAAMSQPTAPAPAAQPAAAADSQ